MSLIIQKYGGSSVADPVRIKYVSHRIIQTKGKGHKVVVVVSAPGDTTDDLSNLAYQITDAPPTREMDVLLATGEQISISLLSMAIKGKGYKAVSLTGPQAGIYTDTVHTRAKITKIMPQKVRQELARGNIVIVAGFQGIGPSDDITTLGRGGSDLTAVALAAILKADACEIYTDVAGVYTADPKLVPQARKIDRLSYDEMLEMAGSGAQVMQTRSIEVAKKFNVDIHVRSSFSYQKGTIITKEVSPMEDVVIRSVSYDKNQIKISINDVPDRPGVAARMFRQLAAEDINIDMIIQSYASAGRNDISFTIARPDIKKTLKIMEQVKKILKAKAVVYDDHVAKVSIVGVGMRSHSGVAAQMFSALAEQKINIDMISTSEIKISCVINERDVRQAVQALHQKFKLGKSSKEPRAKS